MKTTNLKINILALIVLFTIINISCQKDDKLISGEALISVNFNGYNFQNENTTIKNKSASVRSTTSNLSQSQNLFEQKEIEIPFNDQYVLTATVTSNFRDESEEDLSVSATDNPPPPHNEIKRAKSIALKSASTSINNDNLISRSIKYRVIAFEASTGEYIGQQIFTNGNPNPEGKNTLWILDGGKQYRFIAYSLNNNVIPPSYNPNKPDEFYNISGDTDFLYFEKTLAINGNQTNQLNINFNYINSKINITINTSELSGLREVISELLGHRRENKYKITPNGIVYEYDKKESKIDKMLYSGLGTPIATHTANFSAPTTDVVLNIPSISVLTNAEFSDSQQYMTRENFAIRLGKVQPGKRYNVTFSLSRKIIDVRQLATGGYHTLALDKNGVLYGTGYLPYGLGIPKVKDNRGNEYNYTSEFVNISEKNNNIGNLVRIVAGARFSLVLNDNGEVFGAGENLYGELGSKQDNVTKYSFIKLSFPEKVKDIFAGQYSSFILLENGDVYSSGWSQYGQLGTEEKPNLYTYQFTKVESLQPYKGKIDKIYPQYHHTIIKTTDNKLLGAGYNGGATKKIFSQDPLINYAYSFIEVPFNFGTIKEVRAGKDNTMVLNTNGEIYGTGYNSSGELGFLNGLWITGFKRVEFKTPKSEVKAAHIFIPGNEFSYFITEDGDLYGSGRSTYGRLGQTSGNSYPFFKINVPKVTYVLEATEAWSSIVIAEDGNVYGTGYNSYGTLGLSDYRTRTEFVKLPLKFILQ